MARSQAPCVIEPRDAPGADLREGATGTHRSVPVLSGNIWAARDGTERMNGRLWEPSLTTAHSRAASHQRHRDPVRRHSSEQDPRSWGVSRSGCRCSAATVR